MDYQTHTESHQQSNELDCVSVDVDLTLSSSATLARLAEEVKNDNFVGGRYDRVHNRHNR